MKEWVCKCGETSVRQEGHKAIIEGRGWVKGNYIVVCYNCKGKKRIGLEPEKRTIPESFNYDPDLFVRLSKKQQQEVLDREEILNREELRGTLATRKRNRKTNKESPR